MNEAISLRIFQERKVVLAAGDSRFEFTPTLLAIWLEGPATPETLDKEARSDSEQCPRRTKKKIRESRCITNTERSNTWMYLKVKMVFLVQWARVSEQLHTLCSRLPWILSLAGWGSRYTQTLLRNALDSVVKRTDPPHRCMNIWICNDGSQRIPKEIRSVWIADLCMYEKLSGASGSTLILRPRENANSYPSRAAFRHARFKLTPFTHDATKIKRSVCLRSSTICL